MSEKLNIFLYLSIIPLVILSWVFVIYQIVNLDPELASSEKRAKLISKFEEEIENVSVSEKIIKIENTNLIRTPQGSITIGAIYESQNDYAKVEQEFKDYLEKTGWTLYDKTTDRGFVTLKFCKGKYNAVFTAYPISLQETKTRKYALNFSLTDRFIFNLGNEFPEECRNNHEK